MNPKINYTLVGAFVLVLSLGALGMLALMTQDKRAQEREYYVTYFSESVAGLNERASVRFLGVPVGIVERIRLDDHVEGRVRLDLRIDPDVPIRESTFATLKNQGITGLLYVEIDNAQLEAPLLTTSRAEPAVIRSEASRLLQISEALDETLLRFNELSDNMNQLTLQLQQLGDERMREQLQYMLESLTQLVSTSEKQLQQFNPESWNELAASMSLLAQSLTRQTELLPNELAGFRTILNTTLQALIDQLGAMSRDSQTLAREISPLLQELRTITEMLVRQSDVFIRGQGKILPGPGER